MMQISANSEKTHKESHNKSFYKVHSIQSHILVKGQFNAMQEKVATKSLDQTQRIA